MQRNVSVARLIVVDPCTGYLSQFPPSSILFNDVDECNGFYGHVIRLHYRGKNNIVSVLFSHLALKAPPPSTFPVCLDENDLPYD